MQPKLRHPLITVAILLLVSIVKCLAVEDGLPAEEPLEVGGLFALGQLLDDHMQILLNDLYLIDNFRMVKHQRRRR